MTRLHSKCNIFSSLRTEPVRGLLLFVEQLCLHLCTYVRGRVFITDTPPHPCSEACQTMLDHAVFCGTKKALLKNDQNHQRISHNRTEFLLQLKSSRLLRTGFSVSSQRWRGNSRKEERKGKEEAGDKSAIWWERSCQGTWACATASRVKTGRPADFRGTVETQAGAQPLRQRVASPSEQLGGPLGKAGAQRWTSMEGRRPAPQSPPRRLCSRLCDSPGPLPRCLPHFIFIGDYYVR